MATKLPKATFPRGTDPNDFECFGPPALQDGEFDDVNIADMGCFTQDGKDTNKAYHGAVVQNKQNKKWYVYFEWGRTGSSPTFQFVECYDKSEAHQVFAKQMHSKNDKRGEWATIGGIRTLRAKAGKDCYLVRPQATRQTGLPDARRIKISDGDNNKKTKQTKTSDKKSSKKPSAKTSIDPETASLLRAFKIGTV